VPDLKLDEFFARREARLAQERLDAERWVDAERWLDEGASLTPDAVAEAVPLPSLETQP
jgi:hypothetical protein